MITTPAPSTAFLMPDSGIPFGRPGDKLIATTMATAQQIAYQPSSGEMSMSVATGKQQQVEDSGNSFFSMGEINHWIPADCTSLIHAFIASFSVIIVSELGDKTFIVTAIMAMKNSRYLVFISSVTALFLMTVLSVGMGVAVTVIPKLYTHVASIVLFLVFGLKMLKEAYDMKDEGEESEFDEVKRSLEEEDTYKEVEQKGAKPEEGDTCKVSPKGGQAVGQEPVKSTLPAKLIKTIYVAPIVIKVLTMVFVAEWGDRSQISTVILAAREDVIGVFMGSFFGHVLCTGLAVMGGRFFAELISVRTMTLLGGIIFLFFATFAIISGAE